MGIEPPFIYDAIGRENINLPYKQFDPRAVTRASLAPKAQRSKHHGPLIESTRNSYIDTSPTRKSWATNSSASPTRKSFATVPKSRFDKHPDEWSVTPYTRDSDVKSMSPSTKMMVTRIRIVQLVLRCVELLGAVGLLAITIFISDIPQKIGLIIRIPVSIPVSVSRVVF